MIPNILFSTFSYFFIHNNMFLIGGKSIKDELRLSDLDLPEENKLYFKDLGMRIKRLYK